MRKFIAVLFVFLLISGHLFAQEKKSQPGLRDKWEIFAGYTLVRDYGDINTFSSTPTIYKDFVPFNLNGGEAAVSYFLNKHVGVTADFTFLRKQGIAGYDAHVTETNSMQQYLIGPSFRYTLRGQNTSKITLFAHQLIGASHVSLLFEDSTGPACTSKDTACTVNGATFVSGGGVDVRLHRHVSIRPAQLDYWIHQGNLDNFFQVSGMSTYGPGSKWAASGLRYSAGLVFHF